jgi:hypothetical protein
MGREISRADLLLYRLPQCRAIARNANGGTELEPVVVVTDQAEPFLAAVTPLHDAVCLEG